MFANPSTPNLPDFITFAIAQGVPAGDLPSNSVYATWALGYGENVALQPASDMPAIMFVMAVYNLSFHQLLKFAQDITPYTFFTDQRKAFSLLSYTAGPVGSSSDQGTSQNLVVPKWLESATLQTNDLLKTIWGQAYLEYSQAYGPNIVGVS